MLHIPVQNEITNIEINGVEIISNQENKYFYRTLDELAKVIYKNLLDLDAAFPGVCAFQTFSFLCSFGK